MTIECARWTYRLEQAAKQAEKRVDSVGYMVAWRLNRLAGELMDRWRGGQDPTEAIANRRDTLKQRVERQPSDQEASLEHDLLAGLLPESRKGGRWDLERATNDCRFSP